MNRRNFFKGVIGGVAATLALPHVGKADDYAPEEVDVVALSDDFDRELPERRYWYGVDLTHRAEYDAWRKEMEYQRQLREMYVERQRHFAAWVEAKEVPRTPFSDWSSGVNISPYAQTAMDTGQSYSPFNETARRLMIPIPDDRIYFLNGKDSEDISILHTIDTTNLRNPNGFR